MLTRRDLARLLPAGAATFFGSPVVPTDTDKRGDHELALLLYGLNEHPHSMYDPSRSRHDWLFPNRDVPFAPEEQKAVQAFYYRFGRTPEVWELLEILPPTIPARDAGVWGYSTSTPRAQPTSGELDTAPQRPSERHGTFRKGWTA
jgi:hypothetical protein